MLKQKYLKNVKDSDTVIHGKYNVATYLYNRKGWIGMLEMWLNKNGIVNILSIPKLEEDGYHVTYDTLVDWIFHILDDIQVKIERDMGTCKRIN